MVRFDVPRGLFFVDMCGGLVGHHNLYVARDSSLFDGDWRESNSKNNELRFSSFHRSFSFRVLTTHPNGRPFYLRRIHIAINTECGFFPGGVGEHQETTMDGREERNIEIQNTDLFFSFTNFFLFFF
ncbi:hypothetical protein L873DRAFT_839840 [Choiromyces venosus 120613-1]|uniref:Uncharacterized protein n=1 Tax=Choiromyces venosus 120613-1 TaxID=1336337 RepID=A0A3N4IX58_9PEZI|nr:hypothetical protein L873DRAFT_839840 [Choiromyces venosus 120613-1]